MLQQVPEMLADLAAVADGRNSAKASKTEGREVYGEDLRVFPALVMD